MISFVYNKLISGPKIKPCGTPQLTDIHSINITIRLKLLALRQINFETNKHWASYAKMILFFEREYHYRACQRLCLNVAEHYRRMLIICRCTPMILSKAKLFTVDKIVCSNDFKYPSEYFFLWYIRQTKEWRILSVISFVP